MAIHLTILKKRLRKASSKETPESLRQFIADHSDMCVPTPFGIVSFNHSQLNEESDESESQFFQTPDWLKKHSK